MKKYHVGEQVLVKTITNAINTRDYNNPVGILGIITTHNKKVWGKYQYRVRISEILDPGRPGLVEWFVRESDIDKRFDPNDILKEILK